VSDEPVFQRLGPVNWIPEERKTIERLYRRIHDLEGCRVPVVTVPAATPPPGPVARPGVTAAAILDQPSTVAFGYEWNQPSFGPRDWPAVLTVHRPDLLFVSTAGLGCWSDGELRAVLGWCRQRRIPTVFWHSGATFWHSGATPDFDAAALFDVVFVCDPDLVLRYREAVGHNRVDVLRFAAQPRLHNPVQDLIGRVHDIAYAGPRCGVSTLTALCRTGVHIFADGELRDWPPELVPHIVGRFTDTDLSTAATMYKVFLAMDERQALELSACATPIVSGGSAAIRDTLGALVPAGETDTGCFNLVHHLLNSPELRARQGHLAMREVHDRHLTTHRVDRILAAVGFPVARRSRPISVLAPTSRVERIDHVIGSAARQLHRPLQLVLILHGLDLDPVAVRERAVAAGISDVVVLAADRELTLGACLNKGIEAGDGEFIAKMDDDDLYGAHYLSDLVRAFDYTEAGLVGKGAHYAYFEADNTTMLRLPGREHRYVKRVHGATFLGRADLFRHYRFSDVGVGEDSTLVERLDADDVKIYAADRFNFVYWRAGDMAAHTWQPTNNALLRNAQFVFVGRPHEHVLI
jgi:hypothetical protein